MPKNFMKSIFTAAMGLSDLVVGYDHLFGHDREGSFQTLIELGKDIQF